MRLIFAGTPEFARSALAALHAAGHEVLGVLSQPDRPAGRGMKLQACAVKQFASAHGLPVLQPHSLRLDGPFAQEAGAARDFILQAKADVMVVAAYGLILPQWVLDAPRFGCLNIHASLLPRWRGAAPIHRAIEAGDPQTGVTIMQMDAGLDTGDMLLSETLPIEPLDTTAMLHDKLADLGARLIVQALTQVGRFKPQAQAAQGIAYAHKIEKSEAPADWTQTAQTLAQRIRAFDPFPGVTAQLGGQVVKLWQAQALHLEGQGETALKTVPGQLLRWDASGLWVACAQGVLCITQMQRPGGKRQSAAEFLQGFTGAVGDVLALPKDLSAKA